MTAVMQRKWWKGTRFPSGSKFARRENATLYRLEFFNVLQRSTSGRCTLSCRLSSPHPCKMPTYPARMLASSPLFMRWAESSSQHEQTSGLVCGTNCSVLRRATKLKSQGALDKIKRKSILAAWGLTKVILFYSANGYKLDFGLPAMVLVTKYSSIPMVPHSRAFPQCSAPNPCHQVPPGATRCHQVPPGAIPAAAEIRSTLLVATKRCIWKDLAKHWFDLKCPAVSWQHVTTSRKTAKKCQDRWISVGPKG